MIRYDVREDCATFNKRYCSSGNSNRRVLLSLLISNNGLKFKMGRRGSRGVQGNDDSAFCGCLVWFLTHDVLC